MGRTKGVFIILKEFLGSGELCLGKPRVFFGGITLPLDKIFLMELYSFVSDDLFNFIMFFVIN